MQRLAKKKVRNMVDFWADDPDERVNLLKYGELMVEEFPKIDKAQMEILLRRKFIELEITKCQQSGVIEDVNKLRYFLDDGQAQLSDVGMQIIYQLREKRLCMSTGTQTNGKT